MISSHELPTSVDLFKLHSEYFGAEQAFLEISGGWWREKRDNKNSEIQCRLSLKSELAQSNVSNTSDLFLSPSASFRGCKKATVSEAALQQ